ncbi:MAG TPA: NAD(P)-dependent oxidoreductase [Pirellulales bacterium]|jgi:phosphoglycerate dehydrogenase-like enzyme|nr:NAD(P)-dependent oxidoreductase [Pirellulales bacterium]
MSTFRIAYTGDFLNEDGESAYGDLAALAQPPYIELRFLTSQSPRRGDKAYWQRFYSLEVTPDDVQGVDGLVVLRPWVKEHALAAASDLVVIGRSGAGYDKIDVSACTAHDVALFNAPLALNHATASSALLFMLALAKRLPKQERLVRQGRWDLQASSMGSELEGRTLGIVGLGHSGRELVRLAAPFAMKVLAFSPHADRAQAAALGVRLVSLEELLTTSDFVSLHARLTAENHGLLGPKQLAQMKPTAYLINVARGELVDQSALVAALRDHWIAGAGLDVYEHEPLSLDDPLLTLDNVILTPHWSASTTDVFTATSRAMTAGMLRAAQGLAPDNVVNPAVLTRPKFQAKLARFAQNKAGCGKRV